VAADPQQARARALLRGHPDGARLAEAPFAPIGGGAHSHCWRVETTKGPVFIRLAHPGSRRLGADWDTEYRLLGIASGAGHAPIPWLAIPDEGLLVTEFIAGGAPDLHGLTAPAGLTQVGRLLHGVHALTPAAGIRRLAFAAQARWLESQRPMAGRGEQCLKERSHRVFALLEAGRLRATVCHNDVHRANLIDNGRVLRLVDWEYGGVGDPIYDLAGFCSHHALDADQTAALLDAYGSRIESARLSAARWAYDYVQWLWHRLAVRLDTSGRGDSLRAVAEFARRLADPY
jgi:aminoglycoside phosphotransferase (APT) family kinase protein